MSCAELTGRVRDTAVYMFRHCPSAAAVMPLPLFAAWGEKQGSCVCLACSDQKTETTATTTTQRRLVDDDDDDDDDDDGNEKEGEGIVVTELQRKNCFTRKNFD